MHILCTNFPLNERTNERECSPLNRPATRLFLLPLCQRSVWDRAESFSRNDVNWNDLRNANPFTTRWHHFNIVISSPSHLMFSEDSWLARSESGNIYDSFPKNGWAEKHNKMFGKSIPITFVGTAKYFVPITISNNVVVSSLDASLLIPFQSRVIKKTDFISRRKRLLVHQHRKFERRDSSV